MKWFRLYDEIIDDPKLLFVNPDIRWWYIAILCAINKTNRESGRVPSIEDLTILLRTNRDTSQKAIDTLVDKDLLQKDKHGYFCKAFKNRQYSSDNSTERVKRFYKRSKNVSETVSLTDTDIYILYIYKMGLVTTEKRAWSLYSKWKKEYGKEITNKGIGIGYEKFLGGIEVKVGYVKRVIENLAEKNHGQSKNDAPMISGKKEPWENG